MGFIKNAIVEASVVTGCSVTQLTDEESTALRSCVEEKYAYTHTPLPLWERLEGDSSKYDPEGWRVIGEFPFDNRVAIFFDTRNETAMFFVNSCVDIVKLLLECPGFVFYITDNECSFLLCFNDHDYLIGAGAAKGWVEKMEKMGSDSN